MSRYKRLYRDRRGRPGVAIQHARAAIRRKRPTTRLKGLRHGAQQRTQARGDTVHSTARDKDCDTTGARCDTVGCALRHGQDTASGAPLYGRPSAQWARSLGSGCAPCAPNPVLTQCTVLSYCFGHCSLALFTRF